MLRIFVVLTWSIHCHRKHPEYLVAGHLGKHKKDNRGMWANVNHPSGVLAVKDFKDVLHHTIGIKSGEKRMRTKNFWKAIQNLGKIRLISSTVAFLLMLPLENISIFLVGIIDNGNASQGFCKLLYFLKISQFHLLPWGKFILKLFTTPRISSSVNLFVCKKNCKIF